MNSVHIALGLALGAGIGSSIGTVIGAVTGDVGIWTALGVPFGAGIGLAAAIVWGEMTRPPLPDTCEHCGYDTRGLRSRRCPECGKRPEKPDA